MYIFLYIVTALKSGRTAQGTCILIWWGLSPPLREVLIKGMADLTVNDIHELRKYGNCFFPRFGLPGAVNCAES